MASRRRQLATLRRLRRVNKAMRDQAAAALSQAAADVTEAEHGEAGAHDARARFEDDFVMRMAAVSTPGELDMAKAEYDAHRESVSIAHERCAQTRRTHAALLPAVTQARRKLAVTDKLIARTREELARALDQAEQKTIDDLTATRKKAI